MPSNPAGSPGRGHSQPSPIEQRDEHDRPVGRTAGERYGPAAIERRAKEDGRALILYTRIQESSAA
jgi:hypothetical protein